MVDHYELLYLVGANYTEDELPPIKEKVKALLEKAGAEITFDETFGKKRLAYPIKGNHQGYYLVYEFNVEGAQIQELDRTVGLLNELLRHMIAKRDAKTPNMMRAADEIIDKDSIDVPRPPRKEYSAPTAAPVVAEISPEEAKEKEAEKEKEKVTIEKLDEKLDEIIEGNIL